MVVAAVTLSTTDLEQLLSLALAALRANAAAAPAVGQTGAGAEMVSPTVAPAALRTMGQWLDVHLQQLSEKGYAAQTMKNRTACIAHLRRLWGTRAIASIKPHDVATGLKTFGPKETSKASRVLSELRDAFAEAIAAGWVDTNPAQPIKRPVHKVIRARLKFEVWQAMWTQAKAGPQRWVESMLLLALVTGQRRADLAKMRFCDIVVDDDGQQVLRIEQQKQAGKGYGARVAIPLSLYLEPIGMTVSDVVEHCRNSAKPGATLLRKAGGGPIEESSLSARFHELILAVLGPAAHQPYEWPSLHEVRSLSARLFLQQGLPRETVQTLLGHKNAEMTELYADDRGLSAHKWKRVMLPTAPPAGQSAGQRPEADANRRPTTH